MSEITREWKINQYGRMLFIINISDKRFIFRIYIFKKLFNIEKNTHNPIEKWKKKKIWTTTSQQKFRMTNKHVNKVLNFMQNKNTI